MARILNFIGCETIFSSANTVIIGYPYDGTSSYRPGSRFAPSAIREASDGLETYSPYLNLSLDDKQICDLGDLTLPFGDKMRVLDMIQDKTRELLSASKGILSLGGEHLITYPIVKEFVKTFPNMIIIHLDAHADLRDEYLGEKESHTTVLRRIYDIVGPKKIYHFGIRSGTQEEFQFAKDYGHFHPYHLRMMESVLSEIPVETPIYLTIDLDVLDPSVLPGTGTPEPGGIQFMELLSAIHAFRGKNLVGADVVELAPDYDPTKVSSIVAAKAIRELLCLLK